MKIYLDSADIAKLTKYVEPYGLTGFTCNPSICVKSQVDLEQLLKLLPNKVGFFQVIAEDYQGILDDAQRILAVRPHAVIKIPVTSEGLKAIHHLAQQGVPVLATAIYTTLQALLAAQAGAQYVAPYTNRISDQGSDGVTVVLDIVRAFKNHNINCEVVAASFKNLNQINELLVGGVHSVTIPIDLFEKMLNNQQTNQSVNDFSSDWLKYYKRSTI